MCDVLSISKPSNFSMIKRMRQHTRTYTHALTYASNKQILICRIEQRCKVCIVKRSFPQFYHVYYNVLPFLYCVGVCLVYPHFLFLLGKSDRCPSSYACRDAESAQPAGQQCVFCSLVAILFVIYRTTYHIVIVTRSIIV